MHDADLKLLLSADSLRKIIVMPLFSPLLKASFALF